MATAVARWRRAKIHTMPATPTGPRARATTAGPAKVLAPAPRLRADMACPLWRGASAGTSAEIGT